MKSLSLNEAEVNYAPLISRTMLIYRNIILVSTLGIMPLCNGRNQKVLLKTGKPTNDRGNIYSRMVIGWR
ncbi:hypothetical protein XBFM1_2660007 [Xenorhabdus bovienii str. feltiae Moldova]|uniref:Uncharacterized protein n=1 Tax=Xenorhabdus bovienii str. feltiae Moldova TaxID=1398200 RepID=A0A077NU66_XENBV|nr:hypothetical protein XBFM1_2660007 [Xenorhabdus bovienii str. feltiae Moldova]